MWDIQRWHRGPANAVEERKNDSCKKSVKVGCALLNSEFWSSKNIHRPRCFWILDHFNFLDHWIEIRILSIRVIQEIQSWSNVWSQTIYHLHTDLHVYIKGRQQSSALPMLWYYDRTPLLKSKICGCYLVTFLNWTTIFEWYVVRWGSKNKNHKHTCLEEIRLCLHI